jgi:hypothetical protein
MSVVSCVELFDGSSGSADNRGQRKYTRKFSVQTNSVSDGPSVVIDYINTNSAALFSTYSRGNDSDSGSLVESIDVDEDGYLKWLASIRYSTITPDEQKANENPTLRPADVRWNVKRFNKPMTIDYNGLTIVNSADDAFDPPLEVEVVRQVLTISRNEGSFNPSLSQEYANSINSDVWYGAEPGTVLCHPFEAERQYEQNMYFWRVTYQFEFDRDGFYAIVLDQGFNYYAVGTVAKELKPIRDTQGSIPSNAQMLNGNGGKLKDCKTTLGIGANAAQLFFDCINAGVFQSAITPCIVPFDAKIDDEIVTVTAFGGGQIVNVKRGQYGTAAAAHALGAVLQARPVYLTYTNHPSKPFGALGL